MSALHECFDNKTLLADHLSKVVMLGRLEQQAAAAGHEIFHNRTTFIDPTASAASETPFSRLKVISLEQLRLGRRHIGCRVEGNVCGVPLRGTAIELLLSALDDKEKAVKVSAYNLLPVSAPMAQVRGLLPTGTKLTIKEPYYKSFRDGSSGIRVDNPADIVFLDDDDQDDESLSFDDIKKRGSAAFKSANDGLAQALYHKCCLQQPQNLQILSNLAAVYLCQENWLEALKHSQKGLDIDSQHIKCLSHHGVAATNLGQYNRAICDLTLAQKLEPSVRDISSCLRVAQELQRQSYGKYDPNELFLNHQDRSLPRLANFTGPLEVTHLPSKGRGMVVTEDVKAGTLLAVCNPLAIAYTAPSDFGFQIDPVTMRMNDRSQTDLITKLAHVSRHNPDVLQQMYCLYDGTETSLDNAPDIGTFTNQLPGNRTAMAAADMQEIASIVKHNAFGSDPHLAGAGTKVAADLLIQDENEDKKWSGLYPLMSLINHSCCPNSFYYFVKDAAMLRAGCNMKKGDEVTISYKADLDGSAWQRRRDLQSGWQFACACSRCKLEQELPADIQDMIETLQNELDIESYHSGTIVAEYRKAKSEQCQAAFLPIARKLDKLLTELEGKLSRASLALHQQYWVMFTVVGAYLCRRQCFEAMCDEHRLPQVSKQIAAMYKSTIPGSSPHIHEVIRAVERAGYLCPGTSWQRHATKSAKATLQLRYGLLTEAQMQNALQRAMHNSKSKYEKNIIW